MHVVDFFVHHIEWNENNEKQSFRRRLTLFAGSLAFATMTHYLNAPATWIAIKTAEYKRRHVRKTTWIFD